MGIVFNGSHLTSEFRSGDHVDAGMRESEDVGSANEQASNIAFNLLDLCGFQPPIVKERQPDPGERGPQRIARRRIGRPGHDSLDRLR